MRACLAIRRTAQAASGPRVVTLRVTHDVFTGRPAREPAKHRARHQPGTAQIVLVENAAHQLAGGEQTRNDFSCRVLDRALVGDLQTGAAGVVVGDDAGVGVDAGGGPA